MKRWVANPTNLRQLHLVLAVVWVFPGVPAAAYISYWMTPEHAAFAILLVSLWANFYTGIGAWQSARTEERQVESESP